MKITANLLLTLSQRFGLGLKSRSLVIPTKIDLNCKTIMDSSSNPNGYHTVTYVTAPDSNEAHRIAEQLVRNRIAACVNIVNSVESIYEWEGKLEKSHESMLIIKSHSSKNKELVEFVNSNHKYDCPEVVTMKIESGNEKYLDWVTETIAKSPLKSDKD